MGGEIPGAVVSLRARGHVLYEHAFGRRRVDDDAALTVDDIFPVASLTKPLVAAGILQLCEAGALGLDDAVATYLPEFANSRVLIDYNVQTGLIYTRPARTLVTIRHLLTHTSGIHHGFPTDDSVLGTLYSRAGVAHDSRVLLEENVRRIGPLPLAHDPGTAWTYGLSSEVAARVIEVVSGERLDRYLARSVFEPLGMRTTFFAVPSEERQRVVSRHVRADGCVTATPSDPGEHDGAIHPSGGGGLYAPVGDYARFVQALLDGGPPILTTESVEEMTRTQIGDLTALGLRYGLSLGLATVDAPGEIPLPVGFGWYGIYSTWFWAWPAQEAAVLFFSNVLASSMNLPLFSTLARTVDRALRDDSREHHRVGNRDAARLP
jgi:CubicO group peptidase (beta-lactamase class C family)